LLPLGHCSASGPAKLVDKLIGTVAHVHIEDRLYVIIVAIPEHFTRADKLKPRLLEVCADHLGIDAMQSACNVD
jgi:hypothetical protein